MFCLHRKIITSLSKVFLGSFLLKVNLSKRYANLRYTNLEDLKFLKTSFACYVNKCNQHYTLLEVFIISENKSYLLTRWCWRLEYSLISICRSPKQFNNLQRRYVESTDFVKTRHFSSPMDFKRAIKYKGLTFVSQTYKKKSKITGELQIIIHPFLSLWKYACVNCVLLSGCICKYICLSMLSNMPN